MKHKLLIIGISALSVLACTSQKENKTLGLGIYPGDPSQNFSPTLRTGGRDYRNIALMRAAAHSSSFDYNQTAQLVTDGLIPASPACWMEVARDGEMLSRIEGTYLTDMNHTAVTLSAGSVLELSFHGYLPQADRLLLAAEGSLSKTRVRLEVPGPDGRWEAAGEACSRASRDGKRENTLIMHDWEFALPLTGAHPAYRFIFDTPVSLREIFFYHGGKVMDVLPSQQFTSSWKSASGGKEWVSIDLGAVSRFDKMRFHWVNGPREAIIQSSADGDHWKDIASFQGPSREVTFPCARGRYVRLLLEESENGAPFELGEWEVYGKGGTVAVPKPAPERAGRRQLLSGGNWQLCRAQEKPEDEYWLPATVPGTVLGTYVDNGAVLHPNFAGNQFYISDSYFRSDFRYRNRFAACVESGEYQFLHFEGINYQAQVSLNGQNLGLIDGAFRAADFDVTGILRNGENELCVNILHNPSYGQVKEQTAYTPDSNGGVLGADNPTMHATIGWDWIPTVRGRNIGIYDDVWLDYTGPVTLADPFVRTDLPLPDTTSATILAQTVLVNHSAEAVRGMLEWHFGELSARLPLTLEAGERRLVNLEPLQLQNPRLWWPNGYGEAYLYPVRFCFETGDGLSDEKEFLSGVREMAYTMEPFTSSQGYNFAARDNNRRLNLFINGRRFVGFGGNWGYPEHLLNYREREYDAAVKYHADMNFTMIRNWVGMTSHRAFYEACDKYGILIWQDFWLANPWDGPDPGDPDRFGRIATEYVRRIRNHPSVGLYVGRNEGYPPQILDDYLQQMIAGEHPGLGYISHSAADGVSGGGPYRALAPREYFRVRGREKMHSEMGMPAVMSYEGMLRAMGEDALEPVNTLAHPNPIYGLHDYTLGRKAGAAQQTESFNELLEKAFGEPADAREFAALAQWLNYDGYRAMFEGRAEYRRGLLLWMSHPAWPSMVWQTYDYYFEPTAAYFGCKKACEPLHILLDSYRSEVQVVNYHAGDRRSLTARAEILDMRGKNLEQRELQLNIAEDSTVTCFPLPAPEGTVEVYYVRLSLADVSGKLLSSNFYVQGAEEGNLKALHTLGQADVKVRASGKGPWKVTLTNAGSVPALMIRLKLEDRASGELMLPVLYSDNYIALMPGETRTVEIEAAREDLRGAASLGVSGFHLAPMTIKL